MEEFKSMAAALAVATDQAKKHTREWRDAVAYVLEHAPPELQAELDRINRKFFPDLKPDYYDDDGNPYYSEDNLKKFFGVSDEEFWEGVRELEERQAATGHQYINTDRVLHRAQ